MIEVEQTFYDPPRVFTAEKWRREAPEHFEFIVQAWQVITHDASSPTYHRMQTRFAAPEREAMGHFKPSETVWNAWQRTREIALAMRSRCVFFQCADTFEPTAANQDNLRSFFLRVREQAEHTRHSFTCAWSPPASWPDADIAVLANELGLLHAVDPFVRPPATADGCYFRLHGFKGYRHQYTDEELARLLEMLAPFQSGYCLFNNLHMRPDAARLRWLLRGPKAAPEPTREDEQEAKDATDEQNAA